MFTKYMLNTGSNVLKNLLFFIFLSLLNKRSVSCSLYFDEICKNIGFFNSKMKFGIMVYGDPFSLYARRKKLHSLNSILIFGGNS
ncbi:hypothetical protein M2459_001149 [Parabacteroides sp. PF5-5]|nr:hypothetical protein [Parabacteroides sp. PH5-39]MDH6315431.1 hypothetical protein [Parabacteroides sp. PF5-13]MDH6319075.1 hypothetical protein [Parabacteroides sp. PH5-13]MDH6322805.1 hypothetical protein [Parabacteroides sp. PH5-8]MDH6326623.1 hypothetical protein [Parabacteroides sp. PH5-41]MDH6334407.1 hypothetical protein [Parabacteroides sp. PF5-5]MDH6345488.1 hypothetical protein [Parabacteroides sp. PH5-46]MDH6360444.1 hypothetical protein [Parabacteroides sp. PH5-16]MDH6376095.